MYTLLMRVGPFAIALTLVGSMHCELLAAPKQSSPDLSTTTEASRDEPQPTTGLDTLSVTEPPAQKQKVSRPANEVFFPYQSSVSPRVGIATRREKFSESPFHYFLGVQYMFDSPTSQHLEVGIDLTSEAHGVLNLGYKWVYNHTSSFRPFIKVGPSVMLKPNEQLGTFLKSQNYQLKVSGGFEKLLKIPMSLRLDAEAAWVSGGYEVGVAIGYAWAW